MTSADLSRRSRIIVCTVPVPAILIAALELPTIDYRPTKGFLITHNPHPVPSPSRKATPWDRKRLLNRFESGTKRRAGRQISAERLRCSSNMSLVRNQEGIYQQNSGQVGGIGARRVIGWVGG